MLEEHLGYVADRVRLERFQSATAKIIHAGDRVADLCDSRAHPLSDRTERI